MSEKIYMELFQKITQAFPHILWADVTNAFQAIDRIQKNIVGRHCGDFGDKLTQYLSICELIRRKSLSSINGIEIGILFGGSCLTKLSAMRDLAVDGTIVCIDPLNGFYGEELDKFSGHPVTPDIFFENMRRLGFSLSQVELRRCFSNSPEAVSDLSERGFDHLMIDGGHQYDDIKTDWQVFHPYVAPGGLVIIDDYNDPAWPDITQFASEMPQWLPDHWCTVGVLGTTLVLQHGVVVRPKVSAHCALQVESDIDTSIVSAIFDLYMGEAASAVWNSRPSDMEMSVRTAFELESISSSQQLDGLQTLVKIHKHLEQPMDDLERILSTIDSPAAMLKISEITKDPSVRRDAYIKLLNVPEYAFEAHFNLGKAQYKESNWEAALEFFASAIRLRPDISNLYIMACECAANLYDWATVSAYCKQGVLINGISSTDQFRLYCRWAAALTHSADYDSAEACLKSALSIPTLSSVDRSHALYNLGGCYAKAGKHQAALDTTTAALDTADNNSNTRAYCYLQIGLSHYAMNDFCQAQKSLEAVLTEKPDDSDAVFTSKMYLGKCLISQNKNQEATTLFLELFNDTNIVEAKRFEAACGVVSISSRTQNFKSIHRFLNSVMSDSTISNDLKNSIVLNIKDALEQWKGAQ